MNAFPAELRTPPLPVIAFIGCPELHKDVGSFFNHTIRPPFFSVGLAEPTESLLVRLFGVKQQPKPFSTPDGILKADWFAKHRQRRAAVAVAFVPRSHVEGDPSSWMRMLAGLRSIRAASRHKGAAMIVVVVQDGLLTELPPDRVAGLRSNLDLDSRHLCLISRRSFDPALPAEDRKQFQDAELGPLGLLVTEAAAAYYSTAAARLRQKQLDVAAALGSSPPEINAAIAFKLAVLAEFRQDWLAAVASYQAAAAALQGVPLGRPTISCQRHAEVAAVAEVVHFKTMTLLLHQQRYPEAIQQLRSHLAAFGHLPVGLPLAAAAAHYGWLVRQYQCAAEMVGMSRMDEAVLQANKDVSPVHLFMSAAQVAIRRKAAAEQLANLRGGAAPPFDAASVRKGRYLGQVEFKRPDGAASGSSDMSDAEFCLHLECEERKLNHSQLVLDLLLQAQAAHAKQISRLPTPAAGPVAAAAANAKSAADRLQARLASLMAEQQIDTHNLTAARKLLMQAVHVYRRDGWDSLLLCALLLLRDVCQRLKLHKESLLHSLELSCLMAAACSTSVAPAATAAEMWPQRSASPSDSAVIDNHQQQGLQEAVELAASALASMLKGPADKRSGIMKGAAGSSNSPSSSPRLIDGQIPGSAAGQQQTGSSPGAAAAAGRPGSPFGSGNSSTLWSYIVQQLDLVAALQQMQAREEGAQANIVPDLLLQFNQQDFGWWSVLTVSGGFVSHAPDPGQLHLCFALYNHLPVQLPLMGATVTLTDSQGTWTVPLAVGFGPAVEQAAQQQQQNSTDACAGSGMNPVCATDACAVAVGLNGLTLADKQQQGSKHPAPAEWPIALQPAQWQLLHVRFEPRCVGPVAAEQLQLQLSEHCSVNFIVTLFQPGRPVLGRTGMPGGVSPFNVHQGVKQGTWLAKVQHVGALPTLQVRQPQLLLVGEFVPVQVVVSAASPQQPATLDLSLRTAMGAVPGQATVLAAFPDGKLHALNPEGQTLQLPSITAGSSYTQQLWIRSQYATHINLIAVLNCPAAVTQQGKLQFVEPFEHVTRLSSEMGVHTLVAASHAYAAANSNSDAAATAKTAAAADVGGLDGAIPVTVGQVLLVQVLVRGLHDVDLLLLDAQVQVQPDSGLQLLNNLSDQLSCMPMVSSRGSVHCMLLQLVPVNQTASEPVSMGSLQLRWKRKTPATTTTATSVASGSSKPAAAAAELAVGAAPPEEVTTSLQLPMLVVQESLLRVKVLAPHSITAGITFPFTLQWCGAKLLLLVSNASSTSSLSARPRMLMPRELPALFPPIQQQVYNPTSKPQELVVSVQETQSFVFSGEKQQVLTVLPNSEQRTVWTLVAHASGQVPLPTVQVSSARFSCQVVTQSTHIHVMPY